MSDTLGFNPGNVISVVDPILTLLVQANTPVTERDAQITMGTLEVIEVFDVARDMVLDYITPETVELERGIPRVIGTGNRYKRDKEVKTLFWNDVALGVEDALCTHFARTVELKTTTKTSIPPMLRRVIKLAVQPVLEEFSRHQPSQILTILDKTKRGMEGRDIFGYMARYFASAPIELHTDNVIVARKVLQRKCNTHAPTISRLSLIENAAEAVQSE